MRATKKSFQKSQAHGALHPLLFFPPMHSILRLLIVLMLINVLWNMPIVTKNRLTVHRLLRKFDSRVLLRERLRIKKLAFMVSGKK